MSEIVKTWTIEALNEDEKKIIQSLCPGATRSEMVLFFNYVNKLQLDPLRKQIYFIKFGTAVPTIIVSIIGMRVIAARSKMLAGIERGALKDTEGKLIGGWSRVHRHDWKVPAYVECELSEYDTGKNNWKSMPSTMIQKCAEAAALRIAFPDDLGDVYDEAEFDKKEKEVSNESAELNTKLKEFVEKSKEENATT